MNLLDKILRLINNQEIGDAFLLLRKENMVNSIIIQLEKEYISGVASRDVYFIDRLKTAVRMVFRDND